MGSPRPGRRSSRHRPMRGDWAAHGIYTARHLPLRMARERLRVSGRAVTGRCDVRLPCVERTFRRPFLRDRPSSLLTLENCCRHTSQGCRRATEADAPAHRSGTAACSRGRDFGATNSAQVACSRTIVSAHSAGAGSWRHLGTPSERLGNTFGTPWNALPPDWSPAARSTASPAKNEEMPEWPQH